MDPLSLKQVYNHKHLNIIVSSIYNNFRGPQDLSSMKQSETCKLTLTYIYKTNKFKLKKVHLLREYAKDFQQKQLKIKVYHLRIKLWLFEITLT